MWVSASKGRDVKSDESVMARDYYREGRLELTEIIAGLWSRIVVCRWRARDNCLLRLAEVVIIEEDKVKCRRVVR